MATLPSWMAKSDVDLRQYGVNGPTSAPRPAIPPGSYGNQNYQAWLAQQQMLAQRAAWAKWRMQFGYRGAPNQPGELGFTPSQQQPGGYPQDFFTGGYPAQPQPTNVYGGLLPVGSQPANEYLAAQQAYTAPGQTPRHIPGVSGAGPTGVYAMPPGSWGAQQAGYRNNYLNQNATPYHITSTYNHINQAGVLPSLPNFPAYSGYGGYGFGGGGRGKVSAWAKLIGWNINRG